MRSKHNPVAYRLNALIRCVAEHWEAGTLPPSLGKAATDFFDYGRVWKCAQLTTLEVGMQTKAAVEKQHILNALAQFGGNREDTAHALGIGVRTLYRKLGQWEAERKDGE